MKNYTTPSLVEYGSTKNVIKGNCNWGAENYTLDKTGYAHYYVYDCVNFDWLKGCQAREVCASSKPSDGCTSLDQC